ncbi:hypothetical protein BGZ52_007234 [Haplosporangium bisporale]|nr:hypothetical protein BGZ52_007234 [Haplosporangium bisporale]
MNHQRLVRTLISSAPSTNRSLLSIPSLRALSRSFSQKPASTTSTPISTASRPIPSSRPQKQPPQPNRDPEPRFESAYTPIGTSSHHAPINAKSKWDKAADDLIIKLHREDLPWIEIDRRLGRPASSCYNRYYTFLDPNLQAWTLSNGQPNTAMLKRLVYLVEVEKMPYAKIEKQGLLDGLVARRLKSSSANDPTKKKASVINKISMIKKYKDYKILLGRQAFREGQTEVTRAIRRSVELYGENWVKVAASVQAHMDQWHARVATDGLGSSEEKERRPLTPAFAKEIYMAMQEKGVQWGLEDDVIMARKVLELSRRQLNILDILAKKPSSSSSSTTTTTTTTTTTAADTSDQDFYWKKISIALGNHSPEQCRRRWQGLYDSSQPSQTSSEWSDLDLKLLQQGVRRFGTSWADIRAQFLPNRDVSELYPKWKSLADKSEGTVDRLQEPDFVGLLSALDKVGKEKSK